LLGEIRAVLAGDPGNERGFGHERIRSVL
jgi:hypothetical protein